MPPRTSATPSRADRVHVVASEPDSEGDLDPCPASDTPGAGRRVARTFTDATVVARAQDGDTAAFEQLVRRYEPELFRLAYRMLSDRGDAQDAVQDGLVTVWRQLPNLHDPQAFRGWAYQIVTRRCLSGLRTRSRRRTVVADSADLGDLDSTGGFLPDGRRGSADAADPAALVESSARRRSLGDALSRLSPDLRVCWVLTELHEMSYDEAAAVVGVPVSTVRGRVARARLQLAKGMTPWR